MTSRSPVQISPADLASRDRYRLLTSLVVPRPIAWASTWNESGGTNLAPFSYFAALSSTPALVGISVGSRRDGPKDTLVNVRATGALCVNVVSEGQLEAMNQTSAEVGPDVDEFALAGLEGLPAPTVDAPYVAGCPAVLECELRKEVELSGSANTLVVLEVVGVLLDPELLPEDGYGVPPELLRPVGRLGGIGYMLPRAFREIERP
ncbi:MAG TPA: flavin reductase family protein [Longimicrobiales bacterium]|nr:flavin reductase family protein [Longimicrobiales bacterium]